jgi:iron complex outermembrane receptor protein
MQLTDPWQAQNIQDVYHQGFETQLYSFNLNAFAQKLQFGYSFQNDIEKAPLLSHSIL